MLVPVATGATGAGASCYCLPLLNNSTLHNISPSLSLFPLLNVSPLLNLPPCGSPLFNLPLPLAQDLREHNLEALLEVVYMSLPVSVPDKGP
ncbi:hypothetical protein MKX08_003590 [Trichoderma sp. CBMAI-0020]|nr:hypothetical protein MKX08_003590 [Trichoderma sp. CBMAI-0020]